jgi:hypothetical protein
MKRQLVMIDNIATATRRYLFAFMCARYFIGTLTIAALLTACGHTPSANDIPQGANFSANILDNGTKLFTFSTRLPRTARDGDSVREESASRRGADQPEPRLRMQADLAQANKKAVQAMLQENGYCREGYVLLEMYEDRLDYVIRGECRDAANDSDRAKYSHH